MAFSPSKESEYIESQLNQISGWLAKYDFNKASKLIKRLKPKVERFGDPGLLVRFRICELQLYESTGKLKAARHTLTALWFLVRRCEPCELLARALIDISKAQITLHDYHSATEHLQRALRIARDGQWIKIETSALLVSSLLHYSLRKYDTALLFVDKAIRTHGHAKDEYFVFLLIQKSLILKFQGAFSEALEQLRAAREYAHEVNDAGLLCIIMMYEGDLHRLAGDADMAFRLTQQATELSPKDGYKIYDVIDILGNLYLSAGHIDIALEWYRLCETKVRELNFLIKLPDVFIGYALCYSQLENYNQSIEFLWQAIDIIRPEYLSYRNATLTILEIFESILPLLNMPEHSQILQSLISKISSLSDIKADSSQNQNFTRQLEKEVERVLKSIRTNRISVFTRNGVKVDLTTREVFREGDVLVSRLSPIQMKIFIYLLDKSPATVNNKEIVSLYENNVQQLEGVPRRAHYFISEIRRKLKKPDIIATKKGSGYFIPVQ